MTVKNDKLEDTGERMIPEQHKGALIYGEHLTRYLCTEKIIKDKIVLDIASGSGYGSNIMAKHAKKVYGVDVAKDAVTYAQKHYSGSNIEFRVGDGEKIPLEDNSVDVVVTFETIEHIKNYKKFLDEVKRVLKSDGIAIVSTPNDLEFAEGNHFHLHEFQYQELHDMLKKDFTYIDSYYQGTWKYVALGDAELLTREGAFEAHTLNFAPMNPNQYLYFFLVCSNKEITEKIEPIAALSAHYSDRQQQELYQEKVNVEKSLEELRALHDKLANDYTDKKNTITVLETEIGNIKNSRAYKLVLKGRKIKSKISKK